MFKFRRIAMAGALALATIVPTLAEAGPMMSVPLTVEKASDATNIRCWRCGGWRGGGRYYGRGGWRGRYWGPGYRYGYRYRGYRGYWGPRVYVAPSIVVGPRVVYRRGANAHVRWCANRYGSYDVRSDTFLSYSGYRKVCVSPY